MPALMPPWRAAADGAMMPAEGAARSGDLPGGWYAVCSEARGPCCGQRATPGLEATMIDRYGLMGRATSLRQLMDCMLEYALVMPCEV